jgi:hypothetical protein
MRRAQTISTLCLLLVAGWAAAPAWTQVIPNPLIRPQRTQSSPAANAPDPQTRGATAPPAGRASRTIEGEGLPAEAERTKPISEQLADLYVSAVIGDRAVLRSLEVRTVPRLGGSPAAGGSAAGGNRAGESGGGGGVGSGGGAGNDIAGLRSQVYVVRNGEVLPFLDRTRLLVRVRDTTVTLFDVTDIPPGNYDPLDLMDRGFPVAFRGSVDSVQTLPPTAPNLTAPGEGLDGNAFRNSRDTQRGIGSSNSNNNNNPNSASGSSSSNSGNDNNP